MSTYVKTNVEFVTEIMEFSKHGALSQVFVLEGVRLYAERVSKMYAEKMAAGGIPDPTAMVSESVWAGIADEFIAKFKENYEDPERANVGANG